MNIAIREIFKPVHVSVVDISTSPNNRIGSIHEDVTTEVLGLIGAWQWLATMASATLMISNIFNYFEDMSLLQPVNFDSRGILCIAPESGKMSNPNICHIANGTEKYQCSKWHIKLMGLIWLKRTWILFCNDKLELFSIAMICRLGSAFGCVIFGLVADSFGRKRAITICVFTDVPLWFVVTFCDSEGWLRLIVFLRSLIGGGHVYMGIILTCEIASNEWRSRLITIASLPRVVASVCMVPLLHSLPNVETLSFLACLYSIILIIVQRWIPESPQWLLFNRKMYVAEKILSKAAKKNDVTLCSEFKIRPVDHRAYESLEEPMTCIGILSSHNIRVTIVVTLMLWCFFEFIWASQYVLLYSASYSKNILLSILCAVVVFGCLTVLASQKIKLRYLLILFTTMTGAFTAAFILRKQSSDFLRISLSTAAMSSGILTRFLILNITPRLFAIDIRATMFGCCHAIAQLGAMVSYVVFTFEVEEMYAVVGIIVTFTLSLCGLCLILPDTDGRELPDIIEDMDYFVELTKPLRFVCQKTNSPSHEEVEIKVHSFSSRNQGQDNSVERLPAQPIGLLNLCYKSIDFLRHLWS